MSTSSKAHSNNRGQAAAQEIKENIADRAQTTAAAVKRVATDTASAVRDRATDFWDEGQAKAQDAAETVSDQVHEHVGSSLLIAMGIGFLAGFLFRGR